MSKGLIIYSSVTGNTSLLAEKVHEDLADATDLYSIEKAPDPEGYNWIILGFWVNRGTADKKTLEYMETIKGCNIGYFGTLGAYPDSDYGKKVAHNVETLIKKENNFTGGFLCQGRINSKVTKRFKEKEGNHTHKMTPERIQRHKDAETHPDEKDIENCILHCREIAGITKA